MLYIWLETETDGVCRVQISSLPSDSESVDDLENNTVSIKEDTHISAEAQLNKVRNILFAAGVNNISIGY